MPDNYERLRMLSTPWAQRKKQVRHRDHRLRLRRRHHGGATGAGQSQSEAIGLHPGAGQGMAARRVSGDAGRRDRRERAAIVNPLGLFELLNYRDISVIKGSGLGGTSLINANVAIVAGPRGLRAVPLAGGDHASTSCSRTTSGRATCWRRRRIRARSQLAKVKALDRARAGDGHFGARRSTSPSTSPSTARTRTASSRSRASIAATASPAATSRPRTRCT